MDRDGSISGQFSVDTGINTSDADLAARLDAKLYGAEDATGGLDAAASTGNLNHALLQQRLRNETSGAGDAALPDDLLLDDADANTAGQALSPMAFEQEPEVGLNAVTATTDANDRSQLSALAAYPGAANATSNAANIEARSNIDQSDTANLPPAAPGALAPSSVPDGLDSDITDPVDSGVSPPVDDGDTIGGGIIDPDTSAGGDDPIDSVDEDDDEDPVDVVDENEDDDPVDDVEDDEDEEDDTVDDVVDDVTDTVDDVVDDVTDTVDDVVDDVTDTVDDVVDDVTDTVDDVVDDVTDTVDDVVDDVTDTVDDVVDDVTDTVDDVVDDVTDTVDDVVDDVTDTVDDVVDDVTDTVDDVVDDVTDTVDDVVDDVTDTVDDLLDGGNPPPQNGDTDLTVDVGIDGLQPLIETIAADVTLDPIEAILGDIDIDIDAATDLADLGATVVTLDAVTDLTGPAGAVIEPLTGNLVGDVTDVVGDLLDGGNPPPQNGDTDLTADVGIDGLQPLIETIAADVTLDPIEALLGDIDIDIDAATDLADLGATVVTLDAVTDLTGPAGAVIQPLTGDLVGDVTDVVGDLLDGGNPPPQNGDTDLTVDVGIDGLQPLIETIAADVTLDPIEALLGDIDIDIDAATDLADLGATVVTLDAVTDLTGPAGAVIEPLTGNLVGDLLDGGNPPPQNGDTDLTVDVGIDGLQPLIETIAADVTLDPVEALLGDIDIDIDAATDLADLGATVVTLDAVTDLTGTAGAVIEPLTGDLIGDVTDVVGDLLDGGNPPPQNGDTDLTADVGIDGLQPLIETIAADVTLDPVEAIVGDVDIDADAATDLMDLGETAATLDAVTELTGPVEATVEPISDIVGGTVEDVPNTVTDLASGEANELLESYAPEPTAGDTDLTLNAGVDVIEPFVGAFDVDVNLDAVEAIVGDIDVDGDASADLMAPGETTAALDAISDLTGPVETTVDPLADTAQNTGTDIPATVVDVAGSLAGELLSGSEPPAQNGDSDLTVDAGIDGADTVLGTIEADNTLDPIEDILGDIDIDIEATDASVVVFDLASGGSGSPDTAFQALEDSASTLDDDTFGSPSDLGNSVSIPDLPEPAGSISEGIGHVIDNAGLGHGHLGTWF